MYANDKNLKDVTVEVALIRSYITFSETFSFEI